MKYQSKIMKQAFINSILVLSLLAQIVKLDQQTVHYRTAQVLEYGHVFAEASDLSVVMVACGGKRKLELALKSFFYFNTYLISKVYIAHCSTHAIPLPTILPVGFQAHRGNFQIIPPTNQQFGLIDALETAYSKITTRYVYQTDDQWAMTKGFGFIQESINIIKHASANSIKISQVVSNYPYWRSAARLTPMKWTETGEAFHQIIPFAAENYSFFSLTPSIIQFQSIYTTALNKSLKEICDKSICATLQLSMKDQYDKCCLWAMGQQIYKLGYVQVYLNDGTGKANHDLIQQ